MGITESDFSLLKTLKISQYKKQEENDRLKIAVRK